VITTVPGAVGAFRRSALTGVGGVSDDTLAEDTDLTHRDRPPGWRVVQRANRARLDRRARVVRAAVGWHSPFARSSRR
jgi:cellulose synthase/poly-beta-1,6-N-acetylglucosamine synthase-like glycosyltransferase